MSNNQIVEQFIAFTGSADPQVAQAIFAPDFVAHTPITEPIHGVDAFVQFIAGFGRGFPDLEFTLDDVFVNVSGDKAVVRFTAIGTHQGELAGIAPTGEQLTIGETHVLTLRAGKIVSDHVADNTLDLARLLGALGEK